MIEYLQQANEALVTIAQIETKDALDNVNIFLELAHELKNDEG